MLRLHQYICHILNTNTDYVHANLVVLEAMSLFLCYQKDYLLITHGEYVTSMTSLVLYLLIFNPLGYETSTYEGHSPSHLWMLKQLCCTSTGIYVCYLVVI